MIGPSVWTSCIRANIMQLKSSNSELLFLICLLSACFVSLYCICFYQSNRFSYVFNDNKPYGRGSMTSPHRWATIKPSESGEQPHLRPAVSNWWHADRQRFVDTSQGVLNAYTFIGVGIWDSIGESDDYK